MEVAEQVFRQGTSGPELRPFTRSAELVCRRCSEPLQRVIVNLGADAPAARIPQKLKEHCGIEVSANTCWPIVLRHAETIDERPKAAPPIPERDGVEQLIGEIDGSMIPVVETAESNDQGAKSDRLKCADAWWELKNAKHMPALRVCRTNQEWDRYWQSRHQQAA